MKKAHPWQRVGAPTPQFKNEPPLDFSRIDNRAAMQNAIASVRTQLGKLHRAIVNGHECARAATERPAIAVCQFCLVGLCKQHRVEIYRDAQVVPQLACRHRPARPFDFDEPGQLGARAPSPRRASSGQRTYTQLAPAPGI